MTATTTRASRNGTAEFPVDTFRDAAPHLRRPFTPAAVKFKVQATWPKENPTGGLIVAYIDARLAVERLNLVCPHLWTADEYQKDGPLMWCQLTIDGITRRDVGEGQGKGLVSDALKRAAVKFGIGVSLYAIPKMVLDVEKGQLKPRRTRDGTTLEMTSAGESVVRGMYSRWLEAHGVKAFGEPLDHGDVEDAQGDAEVDQPAAEAAVDVVGADEIVALQEAAKGLTIAKVKLAFTSVGLSAPEPFTKDGFNAVPLAKAQLLAEALAGVTR